MRLSTMQIVLAADTRQLDSELQRAQKTAEAFTNHAAKSFGKIEKQLDLLANALGADAKEFDALKATLRDNHALNAAARSIQRIGTVAGSSAGEIRKLEQTFGVAGRNQSLSSRFRQDTQNANALEGAMHRLKLAVAGYLGFDVLRDVAKTSVDLASMQKTFYALTGSMEGARAEIAWLREESYRLGLDFFSLTESFKGFSAAGTAAGMDTSQVREIFTSVSEAATVLGLNAQKTKLALYALEQMLSKGSVTMEELRRQLGDQLPGAFQLAAKAMGMSTGELSKLIQTGQLASSEFLPKFAAVLHEYYGPGLAEAMKTPRAEIQRLTDAIRFAKVEIGDGGFLQGVSNAAKELSEALRTDEMQASLKDLGAVLGDATVALSKFVIVGVKELAGILGPLSRDLKKIGTIIDGLSSTANKVSDTFKILKGSQDAFITGFSRTSAAGTLVAQVLGKVAGSQKEGTETTSQYTTALFLLNGGADKASTAIQRLEASVKSLNKEQIEASLKNTQERLARLNEELSETVGEFILAASSSGDLSIDVNVLDAASSLHALTQELSSGTIKADEFEQSLAQLVGSLDDTTIEALGPFIAKLVESGYRVEALNKVSQKFKESLDELKGGADKAGDSAASAAEEFMKLEAALKKAAALTDLYNQVSLSPKEFSLLTLQKEVDDYTGAIKSLVHNNKAAEASVASMQLAILKAGAEGAEAASIKEWAKERSKLSDEIKKIELGETEFKRQQAEERYRTTLAGLEAERDAIQEKIRIAEEERADAADLIAHLVHTDSVIEEMQRNREKLLDDWSGKRKQSAKNDLKVQQDFWKEYLALTGDGWEKWREMSLKALDERAKTFEQAGIKDTEVIKRWLAEQRKLIESQNPVSIGVQNAEHRLAVGEGGFEDGAFAALGQVVGDYKNAATELTAVWGDFFSSFTSGFADSIGQAIVYGDSLRDSLGDVARSALASLVSGLAEMAIQWSLNKILMQSYASEKVIADATMTTSGVAAVQTQTAVSTVAAAETATAWAPAAATASIGSFGAAAAIAAAAILGVFALTRGFKTGGYTGGGNPNDVAGSVHRGEYVFDANSTRRIGVDTLEALRSGTAFGSSSKSSTMANSSLGNWAPAWNANSSSRNATLNISFENYGTSKEFEVQQMGPDDMRVIARDVMHKEVPNLVAGDLANPNSPESKALARNTTAGRRRGG